MKLSVVGETVVDTDERPNFDAFWLLQVKKVGRLKAEQAWRKLTPQQQMDAMIGWVAWRPIQARKDWEYRLHPSTFLNEQRFYDELPDDAVSSSASHVAAQIPEAGERTAMPQNVRDLIAKLKGKK